MPRIDDQSITTKRPFKKKAYRPWNLLDNFELEAKTVAKEVTSEKPQVTINESISNQLETYKEPFENQIVTSNPPIVTHLESTSNLTSNQISNHDLEKKIQSKLPFLVENNITDIIQRVSG